MKKIRALLGQGVILAALLPAYAFGQNAVPTVDGGAGPCSVEFTAMDSNGAVVSGAQISVHFEYGFFGARKLDLQVVTDNHGRARFTGLPDKTDSALYFEASKGNLRGVATDDLNTECEAHHGIYMTSRKFENPPEE